MAENEDFYKLEKGLVALRREIADLEVSEDPAKVEKIASLHKEIEKEWSRIGPQLTAPQIVQVARHPLRPYTLDYIANLVEDFTEMHGDRRYADDPAIVAGLGFYKGQTTAFIGHQKGRSTRERIARNFGEPNPEGYRKALRVMKTAEKFGYPIVTLIDTPGAYPGIGAEERGIAEAIAYNLREMSRLKVPIVTVIIGEGGSGGALGIAVGDTVLMLEYAFYSVISPEGCAAILWKDQSAVARAAENMKIRSHDLLELGIIDKIIPEPPGGAHIDPDITFRNVDKHLSQALKKLEAKPVAELLEDRYRKFRGMGVFTEK